MSSKERLTGQDFCQDFMEEICKTIYGGAKRQVDLLRYGAKTPLDENMGRHILPLTSLQPTNQQLDALEAAFRQTQEQLIGWLFSLIDGGSQPPGWPDELRLVDMETGEVICPDGLEWSFGLALAEYRSRSDEERSTHP